MTVDEGSEGGAEGSGAASPDDDAERLHLDSFLPYRLSVLQLEVSRALAQIYGTRFNLSRHEWRVMAVLGYEAPLTAGEVAGRTSMDKVQVSRAVARLIAAGHVTRRSDRRDRRRARLQLTPRGLETYRRIVPLVKTRERELLQGLTPSDLQALGRILDKLHGRALSLQHGPNSFSH